MTNPKTPQNDGKVNESEIIIQEDQVLGSEENIMDAVTHPLRNEQTPPYGTRIPPEIYKAVRRARQDTPTGGINSLSITEIAAEERARAADNSVPPGNQIPVNHEFTENNAITKPRNSTIPPPIPDTAMLRGKRK
jgi:hypothetical protein